MHSVLRLALACVTLLSLSACSRPRTIIVGSKNTTEQLILGEVIAQHLENRLATRVHRVFNLSGTLIAYQALAGGQLDVYPEYAGAALSAILRLPPDYDRPAVIERVRMEYARRNLTWMAPLGFEGGYAIAVRAADAKARNLDTLSDAAAASGRGWQLGAGYEFLERPDGWRPFMRAYGMTMSGPPKPLESAVVFRTLSTGGISMAAGSSTDGFLSAPDLKVLRDDRSAFPPGDAALAVRSDSLASIPRLRESLEELSGRFGGGVIQRLNSRVDRKELTTESAAREFLKSSGLAR